MDRDAIIARLRELMPELRERYGVATLGIFGSVARGDDRPDSDVDVVVTFDPAARVSMTTYVRIMDQIEASIGRHIDLIEDTARLRPRFRKLMESDLIRVA